MIPTVRTSSKYLSVALDLRPAKQMKSFVELEVHRQASTQSFEQARGPTGRTKINLEVGVPDELLRAFLQQLVLYKPVSRAARTGLDSLEQDVTGSSYF